MAIESYEVGNRCKECGINFPEHFVLCEACGKDFTIYNRFVRMVKLKKKVR